MIMKKATLIAAVWGDILGIGPDIPWHSKADLEFFRGYTMGRTVLVGAKTAATLPPLPGRNVIPLSSSQLEPEKLRQLIDSIPGEPIVIGGAVTYTAFLSANLISGGIISMITPSAADIDEMTKRLAAYPSPTVTRFPWHLLEGAEKTAINVANLNLINFRF